ncbi:MAG: U32 family peptidase [Salinivirgaceae bacterium]|nr:U32 family peptidase [Salinivirgaceae bacterium]MDD4746454.1 U32 family peptidase [Salinivirgaceae bacterium]
MNNTDKVTALFNTEITRNDIELMAPAGNFESLYAAIQGGANSVYFGIGRLNMRAKSSVNFTIEDLPNIAKICQENNLFSYLTINTIIYDADIEEMHKLIDKAKEANISAIIATDIATIHYASQKGVEIHASTQLNITNIEAIKFYSQWVDVAVLARELNLNQVAHITRQIKEQNICGPSGKLVKIEIFAHGALCMAVSGKCYLSLHETGASANRGACQQTCRKGYIVTEKETGHELEIDHEYIMSPKDLCTVGFLNKIIDAGVTVLKIEGRARGPEYVKKVCDIYNNAIDSLVSNSYTTAKIEQWKEELSTVFNRGFWDGYYLGQRMGEWSNVYGSRATHHKVYIAKVTNYYSNIGVVELKVESGELSIGEEVLIIGPTTGVLETPILEIRKENKSCKTAIKGDLISIPSKSIVRRGDKLYKFIKNEHLHIS